MNRRLAKNAWLGLTASILAMVGCQSSGSRPFPDVPLLQAKKPLVGSQPRPASDVLALAEPDTPRCSPSALAQLPAPPEAIVMERESSQSVTMPHPPWLAPVRSAAAVATHHIDESNKTGMLVSRNKTLTAATERLQGLLVRDQAGRVFLLSNGQDAAARWERVQLLDNGQLGGLESGSKIQVTGTWEDASSSQRRSTFRVQSTQTLPPR